MGQSAEQLDDAKRLLELLGVDLPPQL